MISISFANQTCRKININFVYVYEYFKYLSSNLGYMGERMFVMDYIGNYKLALRANLDVIKAFEKMHVNIYIFVLRFKV